MSSQILYTILLEFGEGTYIGQVMCVKPKDALLKWANALSDADLVNWNLKHDDLVTAISDGELVPITDRTNVWCLSGVSQDNKQILLNVVATEQPKSCE